MAKKFEILDADQNMSFHTIFGAINDIVGTEYTGWMKACWPNVEGNGKFRMWFPKLAETRNGELVSASFDCVNTISSDWNELIFDDLKNTQADMTKKYWGYDLIFAKDPDGGEYIFRGVYVRDGEKSKPNHDVSKRIAKKVKLIGTPTFDIELLDEIKQDNLLNGINEPMKPRSTITLENGGIHYICGRCDTEFNKAPRCPECGQLVRA